MTRRRSWRRGVDSQPKGLVGRISRGSCIPSAPRHRIPVDGRPPSRRLNGRRPAPTGYRPILWSGLSHPKENYSRKIPSATGWYCQPSARYAWMMSTEKRIYTFKDLLEIAPLGERALRSRLAEIGYIPNGRKMFFTEAQVEHIIESIAVKYEPIDTRRGLRSFGSPTSSKAPSQRELERRRTAQQKLVDEMKKRKGA